MVTGTQTVLGTPTTYTYDSLGNITNKSDVGTYHYPLPGQARPHAVTSVVTGSGTNTYSYDANGSMIAGAGKTTTWTAFNKPGKIVASVNDETFFVYGPSRARFKQNIKKGGLITNVIYVGSHFEKKTRLGEDDELVHYIRAGATVAIYTEYRDALDTVTSSKTRYLHRDHLGSVESITDHLGAISEQLSYDPHGKRRLGDWQAGTPTTPAETPRGFTGHEHLDAVGLIHMNGRVYDPTLGRFLSADPFVQFPETTRGFNRYTYVNNNPLSYTDPTGFGIWQDIRDFFGFRGEPVNGIRENLTEAQQRGVASGGRDISQIGREISERTDNPLEKEAIEAAAEQFAESVMSKTNKAMGGTSADMAKISEYSAQDEEADHPFKDSREYQEARSHAHDVTADYIGDARDVIDHVESVVNYVEANKKNIEIAAFVAGLAVDILTGPKMAGHVMKYFAKKSAQVIVDFGKKFVGVVRNFVSRLSGKLRSLNPNDVRFSQSSANGTAGIVESMTRNGWKGNPIDVVKMSDGKFTTIDNTRVLGASRANINVEANIHNMTDSLPTSMQNRFSGPNGPASTWGEAINNRIASQKKSFRDRYPNGSPFTGSVD